MKKSYTVYISFIVALGGFLLGFDSAVISGAVGGINDYFEMKNYSKNEVKNYGNQKVKEAIQKRECELALTWSGQLGEVMNKNCVDIPG